MNPINHPRPPVWGTLDVDTNGNLFIGGGDFGSSFFCVRSSNAQNRPSHLLLTKTFQSISAAACCLAQRSIQVDLRANLSGGGSFRTATNNNIYMLATVQQFSASNGSDIMFSRSTDGGLTFSAPQRITDDPVNQNKWHWFGTFAVAPNGRIDSVWWTRETLRTTPIRNCFIPGALTAA